MPFFGPAYSGPAKIHYLFVDAGSLRGRLDNLFARFFQGQAYTIAFPALASGFTKVFWYDAIPVKTDNKDETTYNRRAAPQLEMLDGASNVDRIHIYEGDVRKRRKRNEQKKVDVMIAVDMLTHTFRRNMHEATLLTGDNDFKPLVDALVHDGMFVTLWYPPDETSKELMRGNCSPLFMR